MVRSCCSSCAEIARVVAELVRYSGHPKAEEMLVALCLALDDVSPTLVRGRQSAHVQESYLPKVTSSIDQIASDTEFCP